MVLASFKRKLKFESKSLFCSLEAFCPYKSLNEKRNSKTVFCTFSAVVRFLSRLVNNLVMKGFASGKICLNFCTIKIFKERRFLKNCLSSKVQNSLNLGFPFSMALGRDSFFSDSSSKK